MTDFPDWGICLTQGARVLWSDVGRAPSPPERPVAKRLPRTTTPPDFPEFMKHSANRIATTNQATPGVEGYVFDGADRSQMAFWTCRQSAASQPHAHDFDEHF